MGFLRKTFYTLIGLPAAALGAEYFYTIKCVETDPTDRLLKKSPLIARRVAENNARFDRYERVVPIASLKVGVGDIDEPTLARRMAKQMWLSTVYVPQRAICERAFKAHKEPGVNLTEEELRTGKIQTGYDVSQHIVVTSVDGAFVQFEPRVPSGVDFKGMGGASILSVAKKGENVVFVMENASIGFPTTGSMSPGMWIFFELHKMYARLLLESSVRRVLHGEGE
jgi:hypothetical protein